MTTPPVALDAMGGDRAPAVVVEGALEAARADLGPIALVGVPERIEQELERQGGVGDLPIEIIAATEIIGQAEHPGRAARTKQDSSMHVGLRQVRDGKACAFVSAGNAGALMAVALLALRRLHRCDRPAFAGRVPTAGDPSVLLDIGANVECRASHLVQFALMGAAYAELELERERPTVALLSNGSGSTKGTESLREAHRLLTQTNLKYVGYVEGRDLPLGEVDVVVTDGFVGDVALKLSEGMARALILRFQEALAGDWLAGVGAWLMKRALRTLQGELEWASTGGAPLLGVNGLAVIAQRATPTAIAEAVGLARRHHERGLVKWLETALEEAAAPLEQQTSTAELPITRISGSFDRG